MSANDEFGKIEMAGGERSTRTLLLAFCPRQTLLRLERRRNVMAIQLPADIESRIKQKVERGDFADAGEVVREAMRLLDAQEHHPEELHTKPKSGFERSRNMAIGEVVQNKRADMLRIAEMHGATRVRIFGSVARGAASPDSDLDLLVDLEPGRTLLDLVAIKQDIEDVLGREVHVVTEAALSPHLRDKILQDATPL
jgi:putative addiction module CopG family antidote